MQKWTWILALLVISLPVYAQTLVRNISHTVGHTAYETNDHRANTYAVVEDRKIWTNDHFVAVIRAHTDYYPYGMPLAQDIRSGQLSSYRYGFQGQEQDLELKGLGNSLSYTYRMHDPRVGRFFAVDPLVRKYPHNSAYAFSGNRVTDAIELEGLENVIIAYMEGEAGYYAKTSIRIVRVHDVNQNLVSYYLEWTAGLGVTTGVAANAGVGYQHTSIQDFRTTTTVSAGANVAKGIGGGGGVIFDAEEEEGGVIGGYLELSVGGIIDAGSSAQIMSWQLSSTQAYLMNPQMQFLDALTGAEYLEPWGSTSEIPYFDMVIPALPDFDRLHLTGSQNKEQKGQALGMTASSATRVPKKAKEQEAVISFEPLIINEFDGQKAYLGSDGEIYIKAKKEKE